MSRLSSNDPASAARGSVGSANVSFRIAAALRFIKADSSSQNDAAGQTSSPQAIPQKCHCRVADVNGNGEGNG
jgi:hypothetical protein